MSSKTTGINHGKQPAFLAGGGEMTELIRQHDWSKTPLGNMDNWPLSLLTTLGIVLHSAFPMFLFWGKELTCFYNDAYRPSLGADGKHPAIGKTGKEVWPEIWEFIGPLIDRVLTTAEPVSFHNQLVPFYRNGKIEDIYWTFCYSAAYGDDGRVCGVLVTCTETTDTVLTKKKLQESERRLRSMILQAPVSIGIFRGKDHVTEMANPRSLEIWGRKEEEVLNRPILECLPELVSQGFKELLDGVYNSGKTFTASELPVQISRNDTTETAYVNFSIEPLYDISGRVDGIMAVGIEVTEQVTARQKIKKSEERFRAIADNIPNLAWMAHADGWIYWYNKKWYDYTGTLPEQMEGWGWESVHDPETLPQVLCSWNRSIQKGVPFEMVFPLKGADGNFRQFLTRVLPLHDEEGKIIQWFGSNTDITEHEEARKKLEESEKKFRLLADSMPQHIWTADPQGNMNYFNRSVFDYSGLTPETIHENGWQIVHPDDLETNMKTWREAILTGSDFLLEHRFRRYDGTYRWQLSRAIPQKDEQGIIQRWVGTSTDIQEIKEYIQQKDHFISVASHELKTPLTTAKGYLDLLRLSVKEEHSADYELYISRATRSLAKLQEIIAELLDVSKIQNGKLNYNISSFDFNGLLHETITNIQDTTPSHTVIKTGSSTRLLTGDKHRLEQVLINLLSNAVKYSPDAHTILLDVQEKDNMLQVSVTDHGIGIAREHIDKLFQRYYRANEDSVHFQGLGIGLYISHEIIKRHKGDIWVSSEPGRGSTFFFTIPYNAFVE